MSIGLLLEANRASVVLDAYVVLRGRCSLAGFRPPRRQQWLEASGKRR
jgi:hypothetical protein